jgi:phosphate transport system substrate-binding protein
MKYLSLLIIGLFFASCEGEKKQSATSGAITILVDESFAPIIEDQYQVFNTHYPEAKVSLIYKPETPLLNMLLQDSANIAIMSRKLLPAEAKFYESRNLNIKTYHIATDAIALITNRASADTAITVDEIKAIMQGTSSDGKRLVFDNANSSTVRFLKELAGVKDLPAKGVYALHNNPDVIRYVHNNQGTIGVIGVNWIKQPAKDLEPLVQNLKIMSVKNSTGLAGSDKFYKPSQNNLALGLYPLSRELYIINCTGGTIGSGFEGFIVGERGQRIILRSGLLPNKIPSREIIIRSK